MRRMGTRGAEKFNLPFQHFFLNPSYTTTEENIERKEITNRYNMKHQFENIKRRKRSTDKSMKKMKRYK